MFIIGAQANSAALRAGFGCVFHKVHDHLHQLINIPQGRGQGWVIFVRNRHMRPKSQQGRTAYAIQDVMQVHGLSDRFAQISKLFDLFKQFHNAPRFFDDQISQFKILGFKPHGQ